MKILALENVSKQYASRGKKVQALDAVSLELSPGDFVGVYGPSGCGKTTLLLTAGSLLHPNVGQVRVTDCDVFELGHGKRAQFRRKNIGFVFQQFHLVPYLTVRDNVMLAGSRQSASDQKKQANELLDNLQLTERFDHYPSELSTGERQRVALARALFNQPKLLLADEPTGNLDTGNATRVMDYLTQFADNGGAVLLVTHDDRAKAYAHKIINMTDGQLDQSTNESIVIS